MSGTATTNATGRPAFSSHTSNPSSSRKASPSVCSASWLAVISV
jgi:hypothetical protein